MRLTQKVALENVGKYIDAEKRFFGYYPMRIIVINGDAHLQDRNGVCMPVPDAENDFNAHHYDFMYENGGANETKQG